MFPPLSLSSRRWANCKPAVSRQRPPLRMSQIVESLIAATMIFVTLVCGFILAPVLVIGAWARRRSTDFAAFFVYAALLFAFSALISAVHVPGGTFIHSAVALAPQATILALEGVVAAVVWAGTRRNWQVASATRLFLVVAVIGPVRRRQLAVELAMRGPQPALADRRMRIDGALEHDFLEFGR